MNYTVVNELPITFIQQRLLSQEYVDAGLEKCHGFVASVRNDSHSVLVTAKAGENNYYVNDPYFNQSTYDYAGINHFVELRPDGSILQWNNSS